ncbi:dynactin [Coleophoma cylindrospora]|uniref:Dynactin subunit 5 n=1 Tax=Coleophoma cylindrospora TaxID=1849047 RepID=A0A3D8RC74_9HELO|nr:dynactin [Coleophoma cylindrospora]
MSKKPAKGEYIETDTGNKVSRKCQIVGSTNIILGGKTIIQAEVIIRGDLLRTLPSSRSASSGAAQSNVAVAIGRYCFFSTGSALRPPGKLFQGQFSHYPLKIGDHVYVGPSTVVEAALIGNHVHIGQGCVIGKFAIIKDFVKILDGTVIPPNMVIPSFSIVGGRPGRVVGEIPEGGHEAFDLRELYKTIKNS